MSLLFLSGCIAAKDPNVYLVETSASNGRAVLAATRVVPDPHAGWTEVRGPAIRASPPEGPRLYLVSAMTDPVRTDVDNSFRLRVLAGFPKRVYLRDVYAGEKKLPAKVHDRERLDCGPGCAVVETVDIALSEADMRRLAATGLHLEILGRRAGVPMAVPSEYFAAVLEAHRRYRSGVG
ncbi:MAG: hypothetical protein KF914_19475 [Rhizobiaceae bacterium]|nr:hypothetical protein [Rhizobiaceae bacterium]